MRALLSKGSFWFTLFLAIFAAAFIIGSFNYSEKARTVPLMVSALTFIALVLILIAEKYPRAISLFDVYEKAKKPPVETAGIQESQPAPKEKVNETAKVFRIMGWMAFLFISLMFLGFYITTPLYVFAFLKLHARSGWVSAVIITVVAGLVMYGAFGQMMKVDMFQGILFGDNLPPI